MLASRALLFVSCAISFLVVAGCSGDEIKLDDYRKQVGDLFTSYNADLGKLTYKTQGSKDEVFASLSAYASAGAERTSTLISAWDALKVPERARAVHEEGRRLIEAYRTAFDSLKQGADAQDNAARETFNQQLETTIPGELKQFQDALNRLS
jgi:hypothetical protein